MKFNYNGQKYMITDNKARGYRITERGLFILDTTAAFRAHRNFIADGIAAERAEIDEWEEAASQAHWAQFGEL